MTIFFSLDQRFISGDALCNVNTLGFNYAYATKCHRLCGMILSATVNYEIIIYHRLSTELPCLYPSVIGLNLQWLADPFLNYSKSHIK